MLIGDMTAVKYELNYMQLPFLIDNEIWTAGRSPMYQSHNHKLFSIQIRMTLAL